MSSLYGVPNRPSYILAQDRSGSFGARGGGSGLTGDYDIAVDGDLLLAGIAAAGAIFFYLIYNAITAGKRKKRSVRGSREVHIPENSTDIVEKTEVNRVANSVM